MKTQKKKRTTRASPKRPKKKKKTRKKMMMKNSTSESLIFHPTAKRPLKKKALKSQAPARLTPTAKKQVRIVNTLVTCSRRPKVLSSQAPPSSNLA